jgi:Lrp/AsnC family leucine-responsive transcriptional regulator
MDEIDGKILRILSENADTTATEMMNQVNLSIPAINKRISKLRQSGLIRKYTILVDPEKAGKSIQAFILVVLQQPSGAAKLTEYIRSDPDVLECYAVTGEYDYILKVCARDVEQLDEKLTLLKQQKGVAKSYTMLSLMEHKFRACILPDICKGDENL